MILIITPKANPFIKLGLAYPIGLGIFTLLMFGTNLLGLKFTFINELILLAIIATPLVIFQAKRIKELSTQIPMNLKNAKFDLVEKMLFGVLFFIILTSLLNTFYWPVHMWDSVALYNYRGQVFASTGFMNGTFINEYYYGYPLLTSLGHTIIYLCGGQYPQFLYSIFYLSLGVSFFGLIREFVSRKAGLIFTLLILLTGPIFYHSLFSYTNLTYTVYVSLGAILIYLWHKKGDVGYLVLSALLISLSTWVRATEPFWLMSLLIVIAISVIRKKFFGIVIYPLIVIPVRQSWVLYQQVISNGNATVVADRINLPSILSELMNWSRWNEVLVFLYKYLFLPQWPLYLLLGLVLFLMFAEKQYNHLAILIITILFIGVLVLGTFLFSIYLDYWNRIGDATERLSMLIYPLCVYCIGLMLYDLGKKQK